MAEPNLNTLDGVITYSILSGFLLAILIFTGVDVSKTAVLITVLEGVANALDTATIVRVVFSIMFASLSITDIIQ